MKYENGTPIVETIAAIILVALVFLYGWNCKPSEPKHLEPYNNYDGML